MNSKLIFVSIFILFLIATPRAQVGNSTLVLQQLIQEMLENNPELQSHYHLWQSSVSHIPQEGSLPDPILGIGIRNLPVDNFSFNQEPMTGKHISLMQKFPFPGKLGTRQKIAEMESEKSHFTYLDIKNQRIKDLKFTFFDLFYIDKALETNQLSHNLLKQMSQIAETRYRVGKGLQQDVIRAQLELTRIVDEQLKLQQERITLEARLNYLLNRPFYSMVGKTPSLLPAALEFKAPLLDSLAMLHNPMLLSWYTFTMQSQLRTQLAKKEYLPDFSLELAYTQREVLQNGEGGVDFLSGMMNVSVPLYFWKKQKKMVEENRLNETAIQQRYSSITEMIRQQIISTSSDMEKNRERLNLFNRSIVPQARQALQSALSAYQVNKLEFITVIDNQLRLIEFELEYYRLLSRYHKNMAELEMLIGVNENELKP